MLCSGVFPNQIGSSFTDHDGGRVGVHAHDGRHHRCIGYAQTVPSMDCKSRVDHGHVVGAHLTADWVVVSPGAASHELTKSRLIPDVALGKDIVLPPGGEPARCVQLSCPFKTEQQTPYVVLIIEIVRVDQWRLIRSALASLIQPRLRGTAAMPNV